MSQKVHFVGRTNWRWWNGSKTSEEAIPVVQESRRETRTGW